MKNIEQAVQKFNDEYAAVLAGARATAKVSSDRSIIVIDSPSPAAIGMLWPSALPGTYDGFPVHRGRLMIVDLLAAPRVTGFAVTEPGPSDDLRASSR